MGSSGLDDELSLRLGNGDESEKMKKESLTIFYNGEMCVCDVTEIQAKAIISSAMQLLKNKNDQNNNNHNRNKTELAVLHSIPAQNPSSGLSMKRSLQRFLQKRKTRMVATVPYSKKQDVLSL